MDEQYQRPLIENFQEPVFDEARKHELVDSVDIDSGLSVVQRTQIREQLIRCIEQGSIIEKKLRGDPLYSKGPITPSLAQKQCEDFADECLSAIGLILGSEE